MNIQKKKKIIKSLVDNRRPVNMQFFAYPFSLCAFLVLIYSLIITFYWMICIAKKKMPDYYQKRTLFSLIYDHIEFISFTTHSQTNLIIIFFFFFNSLNEIFFFEERKNEKNF